MAASSCAWCRGSVITKLHVRVDDVTGEVLSHSGVVQAGHGRAGQTGSAQRKDVVGRVVEQETDVRGTVRIEAGPEEGSEALRLGQ